LCLFGGASREAAAQRAQDGPKLVGSDGSDAAQGTSVAVSADGNTAIVGGFFDNGGAGAAWVFIQNNGAWTQQQKLVGIAAFGQAVALSADGNTAIVGSAGAEAGVFTRTNGAWTEQQQLVGTGDSPSVALSADGNTAIVGLPNDNGGIGAAWVFTQSNGVWTQQQKLVGSGAIGNAAQGTSMALSADGSTAIVGGPLDNGFTNGNTPEGVGAAWVFTRTNSTWTQQQKLVASQEYAQEGTSVALSADGSTAIVGGPFKSSFPGGGAAWVFTQSNGSWTEQQQLVGSNSEGSYQGTSVALSADGSTAMVGGPGDNAGYGAAWVFTQSNGTWTEQQKLVGSGVTESNGYTPVQGTSVALSADGSTAIVGGPRDNFNSFSGQGIGAAWAFSIPAVTAIAPSGGPAAGGTAVTITGSNFTYATAVHFGANFAPSFTVNSAGSIATIAPAGSGTVDVTVTVDGVTTTTSAADRFTYQVPVVTIIAPSSGPAAGGTSVTITGANFSGASDVQFGAAYAPAFTVNSATLITATAPAGSGTVDVTVTVDGFTSATSAADQFTYGAGPAVTSVAPNSGSTAGGTSVTITGAGFTGATAVSFGGNAATSFNVVSATSITATSPAGSGIVDVTVTTSAGTSATGAADGFTYIATPTVTAVSPNSGPNSGGTNVTITGTNFTGATAVSFGGTPATNVNVASATSITATSPAGSGVVNVTVTAAGGTSATNAADRFTYGPVVAPTGRTFVSASGDDASPCTRDAPCLTFAAAQRNTQAGGEIDVLDPGDFGPVTLTESITIDGGGGSVAGALVAPGTSGITVNAGANDVINLRGLAFDGYGETGASRSTAVRDCRSSIARSRASTPRALRSRPAPAARRRRKCLSRIRRWSAMPTVCWSCPPQELPQQ
jgi:hypothetical protein